MGSFRLAAGRGYLHPRYNFAESLVETAGMLLCHSCRSELTRQGISLPQDRYSYGRRLLGLRFSASLTLTRPLNLPAPGRHQTLYVVLRLRRAPCFSPPV